MIETISYTRHSSELHCALRVFTNLLFIKMDEGFYLLMSLRTMADRFVWLLHTVVQFNYPTNVDDELEIFRYQAFAWKNLLNAEAQSTTIT